MKHKSLLYLSLSLLFASAVQALPLSSVSVEERHVQIEERRLDAPSVVRRQSFLDELDDLVSDVFGTGSDSTSSGDTTSATVVSNDEEEEEDEDEEERETSTTTRATRTTPTRATASSTSESDAESTTEDAESTTTEEPSSTTDASSTTSETSTTATSTDPTATEASASQTAEASAKSSNEGGTSTGVIVGAVIGSIAAIALVVFLLFAFCPPIKRWRENREYEQMIERSYRPALDDTQPMVQRTREMGGLGLNPSSEDGYRGVESTAHQTPAAPARAFSFIGGSESPKPFPTIRRKPLPTIGSGQAAEPWVPPAANSGLGPAR